jgi:DNA-binding NarL/FixJ family response regulator
MGLPIVINDSAATYRRGLAAVLDEAGYQRVETCDVMLWAAQAGQRAILQTTRTPDDWQLLRQLKSQNEELVLVALLVSPSPAGFAAAFRARADAAVAWEAPPENILRVLAAAIDRDVLIPGVIARMLAATVPPSVPPVWVDREEIQWLRSLANGATIHDLAKQVGYSERALYRLLQTLYRQMGVANRTQAIVEAGRWRLLG